MLCAYRAYIRPRCRARHGTASRKRRGVCCGNGAAARHAKDGLKFHGPSVVIPCIALPSLTVYGIGWTDPACYDALQLQISQGKQHCSTADRVNKADIVATLTSEVALGTSSCLGQPRARCAIPLPVLDGVGLARRAARPSRGPGRDAAELLQDFDAAQGPMCCAAAGAGMGVVVGFEDPQGHHPFTCTERRQTATLAPSALSSPLELPRPCGAAVPRRRLASDSPSDSHPRLTVVTVVFIVKGLVLAGATMSGRGSR